MPRKKDDETLRHEQILQACRKRAKREVMRRYPGIGMIPINQPEHDVLVIKYYIDEVCPVEIEELTRLMR